MQSSRVMRRGCFFCVVLLKNALLCNFSAEKFANVHLFLYLCTLKFGARRRRLDNSVMRINN